MSIPVLVRSVGPEPSAGYYTQWTTFVPGYPKFKNQDTGVTSALYNGAAIEANLLSYRAHHLYFTGTPGEIVDRLVDIPLPLPGAGGYYDIPVTGYDPGSTGFSPDAGSSSGTAQPSGPARLDITVSESFALSTGDTKVTPWMSPRYVQEREIQANRWANLMGAAGGPTPASVDLSTDLSTQLVVQDFGFRVPNGAVVLGVEIEVSRKVVGGSAESSGRWLSTDGFYSGSSAGVYRSYLGYQYANPSKIDVSFSHVIGTDGQYTIASGSAISGQQAQILYSSDYGATWNVATHSLPVNYEVRGIAIAGSMAVASVYGYVDTYKVLRSTDYGATWAIVDTGVSVSNHFTTSIATNKTGTFVFGVEGGDIFYSIDNGATWTSVSSGLSTGGGFSVALRYVLFDGTKFIAIAGSGPAGTAQIMNSTDGISWTLRYQAPAGVVYGSYPTLGGSYIFLPEPDGADRRITYSADNGDTWARAAYPEDIFGNYFWSTVYDPVRDKYLFLGTYANWWSVLAESPDFPPTSFRILADTEAEHHGDWSQWSAPVLAGTVQDRYGVRYEEVRLLVGGTGDPLAPADAIYDEGLSISGGTFAYRETFLSMDGAQDDLHNVAKKTFGGPTRRGSDPNVADGAQAWTADEVNAPSFGFGYQAEGASGVLQIGDVRMRIHYRADPTTDTIPAKRSAGLSGVAESPAGVKVAVGVDGKILRKPANNPTWASVASGTTVSLNAVEWVGDRFVAVGMFGMALDGGADGSTWTRIDTGAVTSLWAIERVPNSLRAVAVGNDDFSFERGRNGGWST